MRLSVRLAAAVLIGGTAVPRACRTGAEHRHRCRRSIPRLAWRRSTANDDDKIIAECGALIDNDKTAEGRPHQGADRARRRLRAQGSDSTARSRTMTRRCGSTPQADIYNVPRRAVVEEGRPAEGAGRFRRRDQAQPGSSGRERQLQALAQELERLGALMAVTASRASIARRRNVRSRRRSAPVRISPISIARSTR